VLNPLLSTALGFGAAFNREKVGPIPYPVSVNPLTGEVLVMIPPKSLESYQQYGVLRGGSGQKVRAALEAAANLQAVFNGQQVALPGGYAIYGNDLVILGLDFRGSLSQPEPDRDGVLPLIPPVFPGGSLHKSPIGPEDYFMPRRFRFEVPVGGFAGFAQQTVAGQRSSMKRAGVRRRRHGRAATRRPTRAPHAKKRVSRRTRKMPRMVKGSAAAKRYMAKLRRMRKKRR